MVSIEADSGAQVNNMSIKKKSVIYDVDKLIEEIQKLPIYDIYTIRYCGEVISLIKNISEVEGEHNEK